MIFHEDYTKTYAIYIRIECRMDTKWPQSHPSSLDVNAQFYIIVYLKHGLVV